MIGKSYNRSDALNTLPVFLKLLFSEKPNAKDKNLKKEVNEDKSGSASCGITGQWPLVMNGGRRPENVAGLAADSVAARASQLYTTVLFNNRMAFDLWSNTGFPG